MVEKQDAGKDQSSGRDAAPGAEDGAAVEQAIRVPELRHVVDVDSVPVQAAPEPVGSVLFLLGAGALIAFRLKKKAACAIV